MNRISFAFRSFFSILFGGSLPSDIALAFGYTKPMPVRTAAAAPAPKAAGPGPKKETPVAGPVVNQAVVNQTVVNQTSDGAVQILALLQREGRLVDFLMEDIAAYTDDQVGAAVRDVHAQSKQALERYLRIGPVIDGVEGDFTKTDGLPAGAIRLIGNVPPNGKAPGGLLRHKGWKAEKVDLPVVANGGTPGQILTPAEIEVE